MTKLIIKKFVFYSFFLLGINYIYSWVSFLISQESDLAVIVGLALSIFTIPAIVYVFGREVLFYQNYGKNKQNKNENQ